MKNTAVILAGGSGSRMKSPVKKQYLLMQGKPILCHCIEVFQNCRRIDEIILVCGHGEIDQCRETIVTPYGFSKVTHIVEGGKERYHSVYEGLRAVSDCRYVLIHDGARPFVDQEMLNRILDNLPKCPACVAGMPVKDTIKLSNDEGYVNRTLPRERLWTIQTPQAFSYPLIRTAYDRLLELEKTDNLNVQITDDAMVVEHIAGASVKLIEGSYDNIKITTPEDLFLAEMINNSRLKKSCAKNEKSC